MILLTDEIAALLRANDARRGDADHDPVPVLKLFSPVGAATWLVNGLGFTCQRERLNAVEAWLSSLPGHTYANVRQPLIHTLNLAHLVPLSSVWAGPERNAHLDAPVLFHARTSGATPFRLSTHVGDVGHVLVAGPTGAGKSVLLALIALQFRRYAGAQIYIFDKGMSARAAVLACGGAHHALGVGAEVGETLAFQPLRHIDQVREQIWAAEWIAALLAHEAVAVTPEVKDQVWSALTNLASAPADERTLTGLTLLLQSNALRTALSSYTIDGPYGRLLDAAEHGLEFSDLQCFETYPQDELVALKRAAAVAEAAKPVRELAVLRDVPEHLRLQRQPGDTYDTGRTRSRSADDDPPAESDRALRTRPDCEGLRIQLGRLLGGFDQPLVHARPRRTARSMRTTCCFLVPRRSSATSNRRSTT